MWPPLKQNQNKILTVPSPFKTTLGYLEGQLQIFIKINIPSVLHRTCWLNWDWDVWGKAHTNSIIFLFELSYWLYGWFRKNKKLDGFKLVEFDMGFYSLAKTTGGETYRAFQKLESNSRISRRTEIQLRGNNTAVLPLVVLTPHCSYLSRFESFPSAIYSLHSA